MSVKPQTHPRTLVCIARVSLPTFVPRGIDEALLADFKCFRTEVSTRSSSAEPLQEATRAKPVACGDISGTVYRCLQAIRTWYGDGSDHAGWQT